MDNEQRITLKALYKFLAARYKAASEAYFNGYMNTADILLYIENEKPIASRIKELREHLQNIDLAQKYAQIENGDLPVNEFLDKLTNNLSVLNLEYEKVRKADAYTPKDAKTKLEKLKDLEKRIADYHKLINDLELSKKEFHPKRKVGRPKKEKVA